MKTPTLPRYVSMDHVKPPKGQRDTGAELDVTEAEEKAIFAMLAGQSAVDSPSLTATLDIWESLQYAVDLLLSGDKATFKEYCDGSPGVRSAARKVAKDIKRERRRILTMGGGRYQVAQAPQTESDTTTPQQTPRSRTCEP